MTNEEVYDLGYQDGVEQCEVLSLSHWTDEQSLAYSLGYRAGSRDWNSTLGNESD